jgi:hypothetical protein
MFASITMFRLKPGAIDDLIRIFQDTVAPGAVQQPGFGGICLLTDPQTGTALAIGLWQTMSDPLADEHGGCEQQIAGISNLLNAPPIRQVYEVSVHAELTSEGTAHIRGI